MRTLWLFAVLALLAGCASTGPTLPTARLAAPAAVKARANITPANLTAKFTVLLPGHGEAQAKGLAYILGPKRNAGTVQGVAALTPAANSNCQLTAGGIIVCSLKLTAPSGSQFLTLQTYNAQPVNGAFPKTAVLIGAAWIPVTLAGGKTATVSAVLGSTTVATLQATAPPGSYGSAVNAPIDVLGLDANGEYIVGNFLNPASIVDRDTSGHTSVATSGHPMPPAGKLLKSADVATLSYDGTAIAPVKISVTAANAKNATATFAPVPSIQKGDPASAFIGTQSAFRFDGTFGDKPTIQISGTGVTLKVTSATPSRVDGFLLVDLHAAVGARDITITSSFGTAAQPFVLTVSNTGVTVVSLATDATLGAMPGVCPGGATGDLRAAMCAATQGSVIVFDTQAMCAAAACTIALGAPLPPIVHDVTIDGLQSGRITIDGSGHHRVFYLAEGTAHLSNLTIAHGFAKGGNGGIGSSSGGGGAGLGAGLFVDGEVQFAHAVLTNDVFDTMTVAGGDGGAGSQSFNSGGGGGGGLGADGGNADTARPGGAGGGGVLQGGFPSNSNGDAGAGGFGGGGGGGPLAQDYTYPYQHYTAPGPGGAGYAGAGYAGSSGTHEPPGPGGIYAFYGGDGGVGGVGGGGGGAGMAYREYTSPSAGTAGAGGLFGGGGGASAAYAINYDSFPQNAVGAPGNGGAGGGGGGISDYGNFFYNLTVGGLGGTLATVAGGNGDYTNGDGAGGAAAGPAIFVAKGELETSNSSWRGTLTATPGKRGVNPMYPSTKATAATADGTAVFNYEGSVNGSSTAGPVPSALASPGPAVPRPHPGAVRPHRPQKA